MLPTNSPNILELLKDGNHFSERRGDRIHIINALTGATVVLFANAQAVPTQLVATSNTDGTTTWCEEGILPVVGGERQIVFSPIVVDLICQEIAEGASLTKICGKPGYPPYNTFCRWRRAHPWIEEALASARRDRAEYLRDRAVEEALAVDEDTVGPQSLKHDALKWAAGVDHERYNPKTKIEATVSAPTQVIVHTGIQRDVTPTEEK